MRKSDLIRHLQQLSEDELRQEITTLFDAISDVKSYYSMELGTETQRLKLYNNAKIEIAKKFLTKSKRRPRRPRIQKLNLLLRNLESSSVFPHEMIDIYLYACECAINFKIDYNFKSVPLDNTIIKNFEKALDQIVRSRLKEEYQDRCNSLWDQISYYEELLTLIQVSTGWKLPFIK
jgi:ribosome-associated toxin RatA of RatAB toxin-antitoxin module